MYEALLYGSATGLALALTGAGGVLAVPALMLGMGMSVTQAAPVSLTAVGIAAAIGTFDGLMRGLVRYRAAALMALAGIVVAPAGITLAHQLPSPLFAALFILLLCYVGVRMIRQAMGIEPQDSASQKAKKNCLLSSDTGRFQWNRKCFMTFATIGGFSGFCSGMLGIGGGFIIVPGVRRQSDLALQSVVATALMVVALIASTTVLHNLAQGQTISIEGWWFILASCAGMLAGRMCAPFLSGPVLQVSFALLSFVAAILLLCKMLVPPEVW
jgi:uncharacterized membrane protein YfcA